MTTRTVMTPQSLVEHALATTMSDECVVIVRDTTSANLRWANNTLTTNGVMHGVSVTVISFVRTGQTRLFSGVRLSCSDSIIGSASTGPCSWLRAVQTPAGGEMVSMNPRPAITGAVMREAKLTVSK